MEKLTAWFRSQLGIRETGENNVIYNTHYYGGAVSGKGYPWCVTFIWDGFRQTGLSHLFCGGERTAYCPYVADWARTHGQWVTGDYREGDLLLYDLDGDGKADHIGYCVEWSGSYGNAVEGNWSDMVCRVLRFPTEILGAYRPAYPAAQVTVAGGGEDASVYTVRPGDSLWAIAERTLGDGARWGELMAANGLSGHTIYEGQVLIIPERGRKTVTLTLPAAVWEALERKAAAQDKTVEGLLEVLAAG